MVLSRRRFLCVAGAGASAVLRPSAAAAGGEGLATVRRSAAAMGAEVRLTALHEDPRVAGRAIDAAFAELARVEALMSVYREDSQLSRLNRDGLLRDPHPDLVDILRRAEAVSAATGGAFDVTVQPLWQLFAEAKRHGRLPRPEEVAAAQSAVDYRQLEIADDLIRFRPPGGRSPRVRVTLNGIAQGFATDRLKDRLAEHGVQHALIDAGELAPLGRRGGNRRGGNRGSDATWTAGIQHPRSPEAYVAVAALGERCLATSGDYASAFSTDRRHHHIFDPATGYSPEHYASVSVVAASACLADALSTALMVQDRSAAMQTLAAFPDVDALLVTKDGSVRVTANFPIA